MQQIKMAEIEQASLKSEQLSDKSSSPVLPDDLSLDEHTAYQLLAREGKVSASRVGRVGRFGQCCVPDKSELGSFRPSA